MSERTCAGCGRALYEASVGPLDVNLWTCATIACPGNLVIRFGRPATE